MTITRYLAIASGRAAVDTAENRVKFQIIQYLEDLLQELLQTTPIDTGFLRNNWVFTRGEPFSGLIGSKEGAKAGAVPAHDHGMNDIRFQFELGEDLFLRNNVVYLPIVNSDGIHAGFVDRTLRNVNYRWDAFNVNLDTAPFSPIL